MFNQIVSDLAQQCQPILTLLQSSQQHDFATMSQSLEEILDSIDDEDTLFAVTAFVDDKLLNQKWPGQQQWRVYPLQLKYFDQHSVGEEFYARIDKLISSQQLPQLVIYYCMLILGFEGKYRGQLQHRNATIRKCLDSLQEHYQSSPVEKRRWRYYWCLLQEKKLLLTLSIIGLIAWFIAETWLYWQISDIALLIPE
jgi:type IV/VI secretion system ImpK/VasF family protein